MKFDEFMSYYKRKNLIEKFHKNWLVNQFQALLCLQKIKHNFYWKMKFVRQATYNRYVIAKLSKFVQISKQTFSDCFLRRIP